MWHSKADYTIYWHICHDIWTKEQTATPPNKPALNRSLMAGSQAGLSCNDMQLLLGIQSKDFDKVEENTTGLPRNKLELGDLFLRKMNSGFYHAGVYCGEKEIIDFIVPQCKKNCLISSITSTKCYGDVCKRHIKHFLNDRPYKIFRLRGGIPQNFTHKVQQAMSYEKAYHPITFNCWHFALKLLRDGDEFDDVEVEGGCQCKWTWWGDNPVTIAHPSKAANLFIGHLNPCAELAKWIPTTTPFVIDIQCIQWSCTAWSCFGHILLTKWILVYITLWRQ